ncbi:MAG: ammonia-forming cytochrome c nitrite reductase subunit c552 [Pirellulaceae bacterium]|nr:ammonia-forming cytochrome c nitrite reductase subunit c552 [Pirellulaceae bacterium]
MSETARTTSRLSLLPLFLAVAFTALGTAGIAWVLVNMHGHKQEAGRAFARVVELTEISTDPAPWGLNFPHHFDQYKSTAGDRFHGGSEAMPDSKLEKSPWLKRLYAGYAFALDYREARGHAYMLYDQVVTKRVNERPQAGACLHCHASPIVLYRKVGLQSLGMPHDDEALAEQFNMPAIMKGFEVLSTKPYHEVLEMLTQVPDGTPTAQAGQVFESPPVGGFEGQPPPGHFEMSQAHPVGCIDCHDPQTMALRITRPGFMTGIAVLASSDQPLPHMPSVDRWRRGDRSSDYDPNVLATRQEMRSFVCAQCHVEYYCATKDVLEFPWQNGLKAEQLEQHWQDKKFPDGSAFFDFIHTETGAPLFKVQHPEFELWAQGTHAAAGVSCADCHMPYERVGAMKNSNHNVRSPLDNINHACQNCHHVPEAQLLARVDLIQQRTLELMERSAGAMVQMLDAIQECRQAGATPEQLQAVFALQRKSMWRLDYISSENSRGFHAAQEAARILGESIDYSRQAEVAALRLKFDLSAPPTANSSPPAGDEGAQP